MVSSVFICDLTTSSDCRKTTSELNLETQQVYKKNEGNCSEWSFIKG